MNLSRTSVLVWVRDTSGVAAVASISYGAWLIYPPAGFIVGGLLVLGAVFAITRGGI